MRSEIKKSIAEIYKLKYEVIKLAGDFTTVNTNNRNSTGENLYGNPETYCKQECRLWRS